MLAALAAVALSACSRELAVPEPLATAGFFSGRAVQPIAGTDQTEPVAGAIVSVPGTNLHAVSDGGGSFTVGPLPVGSYSLLFTLLTSTGAVRQRLLSNVALHLGGATSSLGDVPLHQNAQVAGRALLNGLSKGSAGVTIFVPGTDYVSATADTGQYLLRDLPEGTVRIAAFRPGFVGAATTDLSVQGGALTTAVDLVLLPEQLSPPPGSIAGKVLVLGAGNANVTVSAFRGSSSTAAASVVTAADGAFLLAGLAPDLYRLRFALTGYPEADIPNFLIASGVALQLNDPVVLSPVGTSNVEVDAGTPEAPDAGSTPDGGPAPDGGSIGAQCTTDNDCASGRLCVGTRCVGCTADADCRSGYVCRGQDCVRECTANTDCAKGLICTGGVCAGCGSNADCGDPALVCLSGSCGHCRSGADCASGRACLSTGCGVCAADKDCDSGSLCGLGVCKAGTCRDNTACPPTQRCDPQSLSCTTCATDVQCSAGRICVSGGICAVGNCHATSDCPVGEACLGNLCGVCTAGAQCARASNANFVCDTGVCTPGNCVNALSDCTGANAGLACLGHVCTACSASADCGPGMVCGAGNKCVSGNCAADLGCATGKICANNVCTGCSKNGDCGASGVVCVGGACVSGECAQQSDCSGGLLCNASRSCVACAASSDCTAAGIAGVCSAGKCVAGGDCSFDTSCPAGELCLGNHCSHCAQNSDCLTSNQVCVNTLCVPGDCAQQLDCTGPTLGGLVCDPASHTCSSCSTKTDCTVKAGLANTVCDTGKCVAGVCTAATVTGDCQSAGSYDGLACLQNQCVSCGTDAQCPTGDKCYGSPGLCQAGNCHLNSDCGQQICVSKFCSPCSTPGAQSGCDAGALCDTTHKCVAGAKCVDPSGCTAQAPVCVNYACAACQNDWSGTVLAAQCPSSAPLCVGGSCVTGNCHGSADCTPTLASSPPTLINPFCDPLSHSCAACTSTPECPTSYVCDAATNGKCVKGNCSVDVNCPNSSYSCINNQCVQVNPGSGTLPGGGSGTSAAEVASEQNSNPSVLSGNLGLYYSYGPSGGTGQRQVAIDPTNLHNVRWAKVEAATGNSSFPGMVIPAPGFPGGELFLAGDYYNTYALQGSNGNLLWSRGSAGTFGALALGVAGSGAASTLTLAFWNYASAGQPWVTLMSPDGLRQRNVFVPGCTPNVPLAFGKSLVYLLCASGLLALDPALDSIAWQSPWGTNVYSGQDAAPVVWRSGPSATSETVYFASAPSNAAGGPFEYFVTVQDGAVPNPPVKGPAVQFDTVASAPILLDTNDLSGSPPRVIFLRGTNGQATITNGLGQLTASVATPFTSAQVSLAADGSIVGFNGASNSNGLLIGVRIAPDISAPTSAAVTTLWMLPLTPPGSWQTFASPTAIGTPGASLGNLVAWAQPGTVSAPQLWEMTPGLSAASFLPPQPPFLGNPSPKVSWSWLGGDPGGHRSVANFDCASNSDCPTTATVKPSCILNRCVGACQSGNDCMNGQGCVMGQCEQCAADVSCGTATPKCSNGVCYATPASGVACSTNSDCLSSQICLQATCVAATKPVTSVLLPSWTSGRFVAGTEGTPYSFIVGSGTTVQAWDKTTLNGGLAALSSWPAMTGLSTGSYVPVVLRLPGNAYDTIFAADGNSTLNVIPGVGAPATGGTNHLLHTVSDGFGGTMSFTGGLAQGVSTVRDGFTARPTFFSYQQNRIFAFDVQDATTGTLGGASSAITAVWSAATGCDGPSGACEDNFGPVVNPLLVGSDGTIYHLRGNGEIQAWDPNGLRSSPPTNGTYPGSLLWQYSAPTPWSYQSIPGSRPALFKDTSTDRLYFCNPINNTLTMLNVSPAGASSYTTTSAPCLNGNIVIDGAGYALIANGTTITLVSPAGAVVSQLTGISSLDGTNLSLANDGIAYLAASGPSGPELTAVQITPSHGLTLLWQTTGVAGTALDSYSFPILVPPPLGAPAGTTAHLMADYPGGSGQRYWSSFSLGTSTDLLGGGAWSTQGGDNQHRQSLKTR